MKVVVNRTKKKIISMSIDENGVLQVLANNKMPFEYVKCFVESKREWVQSQLQFSSPQSNEETKSPAVTTAYANSLEKTIPEMFCGKKCLLYGDVVDVKPTVESKCYLEGESICMPEKYFSQKDSRIKTLKSYLKRLSVQNVSDAVSRFGSNVSMCPTKIEFKTVANGWLKCTQPYERVISLDYRICQLPIKLQQYLIVHAFSHFTHEGHDEAFWNTVSNYLPRYKSCVEELKNYDFLKEI